MKTKSTLFAAVLLAAFEPVFAAEPAAADPVAAATTALQRRDLPAAEALVVPLTEGDTARADACALLGEVRQRQRKFKEAVELLEHATKLDPKKPDYQSALGNALSQRMGEVNFMQQGLLAGRMLAAYKRSVALNPDHLSGYIGLTRYYANAPEIAGGSLDEATRYAKEVEKRDAAAGALELGFLEEQQDQLDAAIAHFEENLRRHPQQAWLHERVAGLLVRLGRPAAARSHFEAALALEPGRKSAREALAQLPPP